ncbi:MAG: DedA family protein [Ktedonobacterales bacterium]|nr:DedA family protein [Ktedonobacterales bacterium]
MRLIHDLAHLVLALFMRHEFPALFGLLTLEEGGIPLPVPGDMLVMLAGEQRRQSFLYDVAVVAVASAAVFIGSSVLYYAARRGGRALIAKYGKYAHLNERRLERMEGWFRQHGPLAIVLGRLIPGLRIPTTVMAGLAEVPYRVYAPSAAIAAVIWSAAYFWLGVVIRREMRLFTGLIAGIPDALAGWVLLALALSLFAGIGGTWHLRRVRRRQALAATTLRR